MVANRSRLLWSLCFCLLFSVLALPVLGSQHLLLPMDGAQTNHLRAYGLTYRVLQEEADARAEWLLNHRGGAFVLPDRDWIRRAAKLKGIKFTPLNGAKLKSLTSTFQKQNKRQVPLEKAPEIAVYTPPGKDPWDDAVTLALNYADIPFDKVYDKAVLDGELQEYDWVHLHHEDFSGQYGKFYASYRNSPWYLEKVEKARERARQLGYDSVQSEKKAVAGKIAEYVREGGFLFAMCSAPETLDLALATRGVDFVAPQISGTPVEPNWEQQVNYENTIAFSDFEIIVDPMVYAHTDIDISPDPRNSNPRSKRFQLFEFSARYDPIPAMLTQNHQQVIKGFLGQTSTFNKELIKEYVVEMAHLESGHVKYLYGPYGKGLFSFYAGHDPEDFAHFVGDPHTNLNAHPSSPGYRLILNNILFPAADKPELKT